MQQVWHYSPFLTDVVEAQMYAVTPLSSHSKAKVEQNLAPGSLTSGQIPVHTSLKAPVLFRETQAPALGIALCNSSPASPPPLCTLAGLFLPGMITQEMGADNDRWTFPFSANAAMKSEPILMNVH